MRHSPLQIVSLVIGLVLAGSAMAQEATDNSHMPAFKIQKNDAFLDPHLSSSLNTESRHGNGSDSGLRSYDAIFYYPMHRKGVSFDVGLNLRLTEDTSQAGLPYQHDQDWLNIDPSAAQARVHAAAIFDLPFSGLKAGLSGSYEPNLDTNTYDYQAKLSYQWRNGLGMQGGWQHQQKSLDQQNVNESLDVQTLFLDLNYRF